VPEFSGGMMNVELHPHGRARMVERGANEEEVIAAVQRGESSPAKFGRTAFRRNFPFDAEWRGRHYATKQVEAYAVHEGGRWLVITLIVRFF
jgi:hypothetical protein